MIWGHREDSEPYRGGQALDGTEGHRGKRAEEETERKREDRELLRGQRPIEEVGS